MATNKTQKNKTQKNKASVEDFIASVDNDTRRADAEQVLALMQRITGDQAAMWGPSIVGFGSRTLVYDSGREVEWFDVGFSPRKQSMTLYIMDGFDQYQPLLDRLGSHTTGKSCLYVKRLDDVDTDVLAELVAASVAHVRTLGE